MKFRLFIVVLVSLAFLSGCGNSTDSVQPAIDNSPPPTPSGFSLDTDDVSGSTWLRWNQIAASDLKRYEVYEYVPSPIRENAFVLVAETGKNAPYYLIPTTDPNDCPLYYRVRAVNNGGKVSAMSVTVQVMLPAYRPTGDERRANVGDPSSDPIIRGEP